MLVYNFESIFFYYTIIYRKVVSSFKEQCVTLVLSFLVLIVFKDTNLVLEIMNDSYLILDVTKW